MADVPYFTRETFRFLRELARNNNRAWFAENRARYEAQVKDPALRFIQDFAPHLARLSPYFQAGPRSLFRIYKDTRFSNNVFIAKGTVRYDFGESTGNVFTNNVFFGNHVDRPGDPKAITVDPMLVDPGSGGAGLGSLVGYKLRAGSPCIGAGMPIPDNGGRDFWGDPVPAAGAPDIGADQTARP